jgi:hypothetical protein
MRPSFAAGIVALIFVAAGLGEPPPAHAQFNLHGIEHRYNFQLAGAGVVSAGWFEISPPAVPGNPPTMNGTAWVGFGQGFPIEVTIDDTFQQSLSLQDSNAGIYQVSLGFSTSGSGIGLSLAIQLNHPKGGSGTIFGTLYACCTTPFPFNFTTPVSGKIQSRD